MGIRRRQLLPIAGGMVILGLLAAGCQSFEPGTAIVPPSIVLGTTPSSGDAEVRTARSTMPAEGSEIAGAPCCAAMVDQVQPAGPSCRSGRPPTELAKITLAPYVIEPPDILLIESPYCLPDQPIGGEHLVRPDGTVALGTYGSVFVAGMTLEQARAAIEMHLCQFLRPPIKLNVDIFAYNSKVYYIIADNAGFGEQVIRLPYTGNETVLDALSQIGGLPPTASKKLIWVARPAPNDCGCQILPVDWKGITQCGLTGTNYQVLPGDRIFVQSDRLLALDGVLVKLLTPVERVFGVTLLGATTINRLQNMGRGTASGF